MVLESVLISFFYMQLSSFPSSNNWSAASVSTYLCLMIVYFASFVKNKVSIGAWVYLWAFNFVPLVYISVFVCQYHTVLMTTAL